MFRRARVENVKGQAASTAALAIELAQDKKFRKRLISGLEHTSNAARRTRRVLGVTGALMRLAHDEQLAQELKSARDDLRRAYQRIERRSRRRRKLLKLLAFAALAASFRSGASRHKISTLVRERSSDPPSAPAAAWPSSLDDLTKEELYERAQQADIPGRSTMSKDELITALRAHR
jgi:DNA-binding transcriptional MocR family regulator